MLLAVDFLYLIRDVVLSYLLARALWCKRTETGATVQIGKEESLGDRLWYKNILSWALEFVSVHNRESYAM